MNITTKKIAKGKYNLLLDGVELLTITKYSYDWNVTNETEALTAFYESLDRHNAYLIDCGSFSTLGSLRACYKAAVNSLK